MTPQEFKEARQSLGLSGRELAIKLGFSDARNIRRIEAGQQAITPQTEASVKWLLSGKSEWLISTDPESGKPHIQRFISPRFIAEIVNNYPANVIWLDDEEGQDIDVLFAEAERIIKAAR